MEELLMCSVCIERYHENKRHPVLLPRCGHSFCRPCVAMLVSGGCIVCPTCRTDQRIDYVERLPTEYTLLAIISAQESNKKETCERHCVKLSFWCRTCQKATCGECLFEDHPTHTHDVIRGSKYINDMKQNAQDVAVKFMEALDDREQNYYKLIFSAAKRISWAIRNIGVLRKDMEDARELMKGIKEEESISAATSLSEAAKFLGLKWNIQDANYNRQVKEEQIKDEIQIEKEKAQEEDAKKQKELKEQEGKKSLKVEKPKEKGSKKIIRKSKTLSAVELMKEVQQVKEISKATVKEISKDIQKPKMTDKEVQTNETSKVAEKISTSTQTTEELVSLKVKENLNEKKVEVKSESETKPENLKQNEDSSPSEPKTEAKTEDEQMNKELKEEPKKVEENNTKVDSNQKTEEKKDAGKKEEITINDIIKQKELLKRKDSVHSIDAKPPLSKDKIPDLSTLKSRANTPKVKPILKKSIATEDKATQWEDLEPIPLKETENLSEENKQNSEKKLVTISEAQPEVEFIDLLNNTIKGEEETEDEEDDEDDDDDEEKEEQSQRNKEEDGAASSAVSSDSGLSESSKEIKKKDPIDDYQVDGKLSDYLHVPGFMLCVEAADGKLSSLEWGPQGLHIHCLQFTHVSYDIVIRDTVLNALIPSKCPVVFLELTADYTIIGRVYIKLWGHLRRAHNFLSLCLGDQEKSYMNTKFLQVYNVNSSGERILGGDYEFNNGRGGKGLIDDLEWNGDYAMPMKAGMITAAGSGQSATNSLFLICTQSDPTRNFSCPYGVVIEGLKVVKDAVQLTATKQVWITDCGVVIVPPSHEQSTLNQ